MKNIATIKYSTDDETLGFEFNGTFHKLPVLNDDDIINEKLYQMMVGLEVKFVIDSMVADDTLSLEEWLSDSEHS